MAWVPRMEVIHANPFACLKRFCIRFGKHNIANAADSPGSNAIFMYIHW